MEKQDLKNKRILIICESPNKTQTISKILKDAGYTKAVVMASIGHISCIKDTRGSYKNTGIYPSKEFEMNLTIAEDKREIVKRLQEQVKTAKYVYLMTDPDREGAQIAWSLIKFLDLPADKYKRVITHEITPKAVIHALENPIPLEDDLIEAAQTRLILDKMVGYALTPVARYKLGARSVGRCQSAGLKIIVDREKEIRDFVPENYYDLYLNFTKNEVDFKAKYVGTDDKTVNHLATTEEVQKVKDECIADYIIKNITKKERHESPKPPFCTATFQQEVNNKLGLSIKSAMSCAQKLFEGISVDGEHIGLITYHRTDSTEFAPEFIPVIKDYVNNNFKNYIGPRVGKKQATDQDGHECLRCVDPSMTPEKLAEHVADNLLVKVYKIIWQRTIASVMPDAIISETTYTIYNNEHKFNLTSNELTFDGYKQIYNYKDDETVENNICIKETFVQDEILRDCNLKDILKQTQPPARYKEASFVKELQKQEIGRPSTYSMILDTILSSTRGYCELIDKQIVPTERGIQLSDFLAKAFSSIISIDYTRKLEKSLDSIAQGKLSKLDFLNSFYTDLEIAIEANTDKGPTLDPSKICPKCGAAMMMRRSKYGKVFYGCSRYPQCKGAMSAN